MFKNEIVVQINSVYPNGSTGYIVKNIKEALDENNIQNFVCFSLGKEEQNTKKVQNLIEEKLVALFSRVTGKRGLIGFFATHRVIKFLKQVKPSVVILHNIHSNDFNLLRLFNFLNKRKIKVIYVMHDCWGFTGYCTHFQNPYCEKWKSICYNCPQRKQYSWFFDKSKYLFLKKKECLINSDLYIVSPSSWLKNYINDSFLKEKKCLLIHNGITFDESKNSNNEIVDKVTQKAGGKKILLAVASNFNYKKGIDYLREVSLRISNEYFLVIVGNSTENFESENAFFTGPILNKQILNEIYSRAHIFLNPTREDNFPTVLIESLYFGVPAITFDVGGCSEIVDNNCGFLVKPGDLEGFIDGIKNIEQKYEFYSKNARTKSRQFCLEVMKEKYVNFIKTLLP